MSYGTNENLENEIARYQKKSTTCIVVGAIIAVACLVAIIVISIYSNKVADDIATAYGYGEISYEEAMEAINGLIVWSFVEGLFGLGITGGVAIAVAGGVVNSVKAKNRRKILARRDISDNYGGNGVEF